MTTKKVVQFVIREMKLSDEAELQSLWKTVGFSPMSCGIGIYRRVHTSGLFVAQDVDTEKIIGFCRGVHARHDLGYIGFYCVQPELQGQGIGHAIWSKAMNHIGDRNASLFAFNEKMGELYRTKCGFTYVPNRRLVHMTGQVVVNDSVVNKVIDGITLQPFTEDIVPTIVKYDDHVCDGLDRRILIEELSKASDTWCLAAVDEHREVVGYVAMYATVLGVTKVGPLYANSADIAELLVNACFQSVPSKYTHNILYTCWTTNPTAIDIAKRMGLIYQKDRPFLLTRHNYEGQHIDKQFCISDNFLYPF